MGLEALRRSETKAQAAMVIIKDRMVDEVAAVVFLEDVGRSAMLLAELTEKGDELYVRGQWTPECRGIWRIFLSK